MQGAGGASRQQDDNRSMLNQSMIRKLRTVALKFSTTFKSEAEINQAKDRLSAMQRKEWTFLEGKDSIIAYTDKKGINLSRGRQTAELASKA